MTPHRRRIKGRAVGSLILEWERKPLGRIYRATGLAPTQAGRRQLVRLKAACETLFQQDRLDILTAVRDGLVHPMRLLEAQRGEQLRALPTAASLALTAPSFKAWIAGTENDDTRKGREAVWKKLHAARPTMAIGELPQVVHLVMQAMAATPASANRIREQAMAFVRDILGRTHDLHRALEALAALTTKPVRRRIHLTVDQFHAILPSLGPAREAFWALCLTGMNPKEYWGKWEVEGLEVRIHGTKARHRERIVPWLAPIAAPTVSRDILIWWLNKAGLYPYAARHSYSRWLTEAGIPEWRVEAYMGHRPRTMTQGYQRGDMRPYLVGDGALLRTHLKLPALRAKLKAEA